MRLAGFSSHGKSLMRLGIFGGTFDPPHIGHLILAEEARSQLDLARVLWVLTPNPPHKIGQAITALEDRLALLKAALADDPDFELSEVDLQRPPPHYAVDTMRLVGNQYPGAQLVYLMGSDSLADLPRWHRPQEFVLACDGIGVMPRPGKLADIDQLEALLPGIRQRVQLIDAPRLDISSSLLRQRMAAGLPFRYYLAPAVYQLIKERALYGVNSLV